MVVSDNVSGRSKGNLDRSALSVKNVQDHNEINKIPECKSPEVREKCIESLRYFLEELFPDPPFFTNPFGPVQLSSINHEEAVFRGSAGNINKLEPRGYGKSTRSVLGSVWAVLVGLQPFVMVCCDSTEKSADLLRMAMLALSSNQRLLDAFPEVWPFWVIDGNPHRAQYQTWQGKKTKISIKGDTIQMPTLDGKFPSEGCLIVARPYKKARGKNIDGKRPSVVVLDDVQSSEEAGSFTSVRKNIKTLTSDIYFLGSREMPVVIVNNATIIEHDDYPSKVATMDAFTTVRYKMVTSFPDGCDPQKNVYSKEWTEYFKIRGDFNVEIVGDKQRGWKNATEYYLKNRKVMDKGSSCTWDYAFSKARKFEESTIQSAMNYITELGWDSFSSECQNEAPSADEDQAFLSKADIAAKQHPQKKGIVPPDATKVVAYIDVQQEMLFYEIWAYNEYFSGYKIGGGEYPDQKSMNFEKRSIKHKLSATYKAKTLEARIKQALLDVWGALLDMEFRRYGDGMKLQIELIGTDTGYKGTTVESAYLDSPQKSRLVLCRGYGFTAKKKPQRMKECKRGEKKGFGWYLGKAKRGIQTLEIDTNILKTFFHQRLATSMGDPGSFSLWGGSPGTHVLTANHYKAEYRTTLDGPWGIIDEWDVVPGRPDNDRFDCGVGCVALASHGGITMTGTDYAESGGGQRKKIVASKWGKVR